MAMIDKPISLDELGARCKAIGPFRRASVLDVAGIATVLLFVSKTVGTTQELTTATEGAGASRAPSEPWSTVNRRCCQRARQVQGQVQGQASKPEPDAGNQYSTRRTC